jgi:hypothetical protein
MENSRIKIGILGAASIAKKSIIPTLVAMSSKFELVGVASRTFEKAQELSVQYKFLPFSDYQNLIDFKGLNAIYIPLPNSLHAEWIRKALNKGLHVIVEKSLACDYDEAVLLNNLARSKNLVLIENFQFRFHSQLAFIKEKIQSGVIGELRSMKSAFGFPSLPIDDIRLKKELGGGALLDAGAYPVKITQYFFGYDVEVKAASLNYFNNSEVDIWGGAFIKQKNGPFFSEISFGFNNYYQCSIEFWGSKGILYTNRIFTSPKEYKPIISIKKDNQEEIIELESDNHFEKMFVHFYNLIYGLQSKEDEYVQNIHQARLINEIKIKSNE